MKNNLQWRDFPCQVDFGIRWNLLESGGIHPSWPTPQMSGNEKELVEMTTTSRWFNATVTTTDEPSEGNPGKAHQGSHEQRLLVEFFNARCEEHLTTCVI